MFGASSDLGRDYRSALEKAPKEEHLLSYHAPPLHVAADLAGIREITDGHMRLYHEQVVLHGLQEEAEEEIFEIKQKGAGEDGWRRVTKAEWIRAERSAGFRPKMSSTDPRYWTTCATGQFSSSDSYSGRRRSS